MSKNAKLLLAALALALEGCIMPGAGVSPFGRPATVYLNNGRSESGELLAVGGDSIWLLQRSELAGFRTAAIDKVHVERHRFDGWKTLGWMAAAGVATGVSLQIACNKLDGEPDCGGVGVSTAGFFAFIGTIFAISNDHSSMYHLSPRDTTALRAHARFPQGLPESRTSIVSSPQPAGVVRRP